ncbi:MAG TPA: cobalamin-binding protein [Woeseiaceae bacterium]|nr:cobalamin-binding protein [Woeseiaceae bacterium]
MDCVTLSPHLLLPRRFLAAFALLCLAACQPTPGAPPPEIIATRVVTLAPQLTELVFAAGAGDTLVGVSAYSDFPPAARDLPVVSDAFTVDQEQLALLQPDLVLAWQSGTPINVVEELRARGYRVATLSTGSLAEIGTAIERIGALTGHADTAHNAASEFADALHELAARHAKDERISIFFQISERPLYTINGAHYISEILELCGGRNVFSDLDELAPAVSVEAVIRRDPEVFLASSPASPAPFRDWARWPQLAANRDGNLFVIDPNTISRASPRLLIGARRICETLDIARDNRRRVRAAAGAADS